MKKLLKYKFDVALEKNFLNLVFFLFILAALGIILLAAIFYFLYLIGAISAEGFFAKYLWQTFAYFIDVGTIAADDYDQNSSLTIFYKIVITIFGIIVFSTLIGIISQALSNRIEELREGKGAVGAQDHIVIFNYTKKTIPLLSEFFLANEDKKKTIVILSEYKPSEILAKIESVIDIPKNINLVCRKGFGWQKKMPNFLNLKDASQVIFLKPDISEEYESNEDCDAEVGKSLTSILSSDEWVTTGGKVVAEFSSKQKKQLYSIYNLERIKKTIHFSSIESYPSIIESEDLRGRVIAQSVNTPDIVEIYDEVFGFTGSEIYFMRLDEDLNQFEDKLKKLEGKNLFEINQVLDRVILLGLYNSVETGKSHNFEDIFEPMKIEIEANKKEPVNFKNYKGLIFIAEDKKQILSEFSNLKIGEVHDVKDISPNFKAFDYPLNLAILANDVEETRVLKIAEFISSSSIYNNIESITIFSNQNLLEKIDQTNDAELKKTNDKLRSKVKVDYQIFDFDLFYKNSTYPFENLKEHFKAYNSFVCLFSDDADLDDNINNVKDNKIINNFVIFSNLDFNNHEFNKRPHNFISEIGAFKSKDILERYKTEIYSPFYGSDIIDINTLTSKFIAQASIDKKNVALFDIFLNGNLFFKTYSLFDEKLSTSFCELEKYFAKKNETLVGIINYKFKDVQNYLQSSNPMPRRKISEILINPDQRQNLNLDKGDRVITLCNKKYN